MSTGEELERNETATPFKLAEARRRGQVARSIDIVSALVLTAAAVTFYAQGWEALLGLFGVGRRLLGLMSTVASSSSSGWALWQLLADALRSALALVLPLFGGVLIVAVLANVGQTGPVWSFHPLKPDWTRINPMTGFRRIWALKTLFDAARSCVKIAVVCCVVAAILRDLLPQFGQLAEMTTFGQAGALVQDIAALALKVSVALCVLALLDLVFSRRQFAKSMRMSRREVREEFKQREGEPRIRARMRELRREMVKRALSLRRTGDADVVITNPTHLAVALRYKHGEMSAPVLVCKGAGAMAAAMRTIAMRHRVPIVRSPSLARALHRGTPIDTQIPSELFPEVARLMVWILSMKLAASGGCRSRT